MNYRAASREESDSKEIERAFECSDKPLEGDLAQVSSALKWKQTLTFSALRWTAALRDLRQSGMPPDRLRLKMGLSALQRWKETLALLRRLAV